MQPKYKIQVFTYQYGPSDWENYPSSEFDHLGEAFAKLEELRAIGTIEIFGWSHPVTREYRIVQLKPIIKEIILPL
jgi:hypothetical protein